jgi:hypothetical protein
MAFASGYAIRRAIPSSSDNQGKSLWAGQKNPQPRTPFAKADSGENRKRRELLTNALGLESPTYTLPWLMRAGK